MDYEKTKKLLIYLAAIYWAFVIGIYAAAGTQFRYRNVSSDVLSPSALVGEITDEISISQRMVVPADRLDVVEVMMTNHYRNNTGTIRMLLKDETGKELANAQLEASVVQPDAYSAFYLSSPLEGYRGKTVYLTFTAEGCTDGNAVSFYYGNSVSTGRFDIVKQIGKNDLYSCNGETGAGMLCAKMAGICYLAFYKYYWLIVGGAFMLGLAAVVLWWHRAKQGKNNPLVLFYAIYTRYGFLIHQLVARDFKTKYKRSALGMFWSFLNPLLTMCVQYIVFSTLFKSSIPNFPVYLLTGVVFFSFFNEAVNMGMTSITGNASLIKKVYVPKYIYPFSKVLSSLVNFVLSFLPILLVMVLTKTPFRPSLFLLCFDVLCLLGFITGMVLLLSTFMTFFQDTQFLWGVISMIWMYLTPTFYPETIIPAQYLTLYHMNPMYQYITFARICIIDGVSPEPMSYLWCILSSSFVLLVGILVFRKKQDQFVLYL